MCPSVSALLTEHHGLKVHLCGSKCQCLTPFHGKQCARACVCVCVCVGGQQGVFNPSSVDGHLSCFTLGYYESRCYKHLCANFCVDTLFASLEQIDTQEQNCWVRWQLHF